MDNSNLPVSPEIASGSSSKNSSDTNTSNKKILTSEKNTFASPADNHSQTKSNRKILWIVLGILVVVCCCIFIFAAFFSASLLNSTFNLNSSQSDDFEFREPETRDDIDSVEDTILDDSIDTNTDRAISQDTATMEQDRGDSEDRVVREQDLVSEDFVTYQSLNFNVSHPDDWFPSRRTGPEGVVIFDYPENNVPADEFLNSNISINVQEFSSTNITTNFCIDYRDRADSGLDLNPQYDSASVTTSFVTKIGQRNYDSCFVRISAVINAEEVVQDVYFISGDDLSMVALLSYETGDIATKSELENILETLDF